MKKQIYQTIAGIISLVFLFGALQAQTVTLTFTGKDINNNWVRLDHVVVTNLTKGWQETLVYPDTTLTMQNSTGIGDMETRYTTSLQLYQNNPNPFTDITDVNLTVADAGAVTLEIADVNGRIVETRHGTSLQPGTHQFRISLSAAGTYVLTARQNGKTSSVKMVCNGAGNGNGIEYTGTVVETRYTTSLQPKSASPQPKSITTNPFTFGDMMEYVGYATINGTEMESQRITQAQGASQTFALQFDAIQLYTPLVTTAPVSDITATTATCGGSVTSDGGTTVIGRGICWSISQNPTVENSHAIDGTGLGSFTIRLTELTPNTTYYIRAYATNSMGTAYGEEMRFTTECDTVTINGETSISIGQSTMLTASGASSYLWSTGDTTATITVSPDSTTTYSVTGTNQHGCADTASVTIIVGTEGLPCLGTPTLTDIDGNVYNTIQIGQQCWMKENLRTIHYADNTEIPAGNTYSSIEPYRYVPNNDEANVTTYGYLYNWTAVMHGAASSETNPSGVQGICPTGWHVPSDAEWKQMEMAVGMSQSDADNTGYRGDIAARLCGNTGWERVNIDNAAGNTSATGRNSSGFSALPAGIYNGSCSHFGYYAGFWSATENNSNNAYNRDLSYGCAIVGRLTIDKHYGYSVRCVRD